MDNMSKFHNAWHNKIHAKYFDGWNNLSLRGLRKTYESYNEIRLFQKYKHSVIGREFVEVGCATGELYRYLNKNHNSLNYHGLDISEPAILRARDKYPEGEFNIINEKTPVSESIKSLKINPAVIFSRDVVIHQPKPFDFLQDIISIPSELTILRFRTRDKGPTVLDPEKSCQWHYGTWVPYMILNIDEVIELIRKNFNFEILHIKKNYMVLGGYVRRFLPKECYYPETGTAETSCVIKISENKVEEPKIIIEERKDSNASLNLFNYKLDYVTKKVRKVLFK
ncbi:MAG: class I SAM-dependent methyltransferase [Candidatus Brocadiaceae bacterium]|nr:class I SAM-dependent methyltransferase [Candidatus Brocadiaceae bacterium]